MTKLLFLLLAPASAWAQGGLGYFYMGTGAADLGKYQSALQTSLGDDLQIVGPGIHFGGRGMGSFGNRVFIGGNGFSGTFASGETANGAAEVNLAMGFFNIGVAAVARNRVLFVPFIGIGAGGTGVSLKNENPARSVYFDQTAAVAYERTRKYSNSGFGAEAGVSLQFIVTGKRENPAGLALGLEAGGLLRAPGRWRDSDGNVIRGPERMGFQGAYLRLTIGGGGFSIKNNRRKKQNSDFSFPPSEN